MDKVLRPKRFDADPNEASSTKRWQHWQTTFENFLETIEGDNLNRLNVLINFLPAEVYEFISEAQSYEDARNTLKSIYVKLRMKCLRDINCTRASRNLVKA